MTDPCRWVEDPDVPGGRFLIPGCYNRALNGDDADCHCETISYPDDAGHIERCPHCGQIMKGDRT